MQPILPALTKTQQSKLRALIQKNRTRALWHMPEDYYPPDITAAQDVLKRIAARGDRATFVQARQLLNELKELH